jgi:DNA-binding PadR family transcriptional regulator
MENLRQIQELEKEHSKEIRNLNEKNMRLANQIKEISDLVKEKKQQRFKNLSKKTPLYVF